MPPLRHTVERFFAATPYYLKGSPLDPACLVLVSPLIIAFCAAALAFG